MQNGCQITCDCQWHQPVIQEVEPLLVSAEKTITVFSFPESQSQATLSTTQASNACTPISLLISSAVYSNTMPELSLNNLKEIQDFYVNKIKQGNLLYDIIDQPVQQPNLEVNEVLESIKMPVKVGPGGFIGIMDLPQFKTELERMFDNKENMSAVMITPPDKSFTLGFRKTWPTHFAYPIGLPHWPTFDQMSYFFFSHLFSFSFFSCFPY